MIDGNICRVYHGNECIKTIGTLCQWRIWPILYDNWKTVQDRKIEWKIVLFTNRKLHTGFRLVSTSLVTHPAADTIQGRCTGAQVSTRRCSTVSYWPLCTSVIVLQPLPAAVNWRWSTVRPADTDKLLWQKFCCMRPDSLEQSAC